jgi:chromosome segregation ATPase
LGSIEWSYRSVLNKRKELFELSRSEVAYWKDLAERTTNDATRQVEQLERLLAKEQDLTADAKGQITQLTETISRLSGQLSSLGHANSSVGLLTSAIGQGTQVPRAAPVMDWTSDGWRPRR